jgi:hypothetical protein
MNDTHWQKARASDSSGSCVQVRRQDGMIKFRDSKDPEGPIQTYRIDEFAAFISGAKNGEFDHLLGGT